uniref:Uncharacterized protein n=1 Tax=Mesocestoides corti TaxID=53468 RepID=A0A5K3FL21_MESCO
MCVNRRSLTTTVFRHHDDELVKELTVACGRKCPTFAIIHHHFMNLNQHLRKRSDTKLSPQLCEPPPRSANSACSAFPPDTSHLSAWQCRRAQCASYTEQRVGA